MDAETAAAWTSAAQSVQGAASVIATGDINKETKQWNEKIMQQQRDWNIQDRDYANQYNSPTATMARLKGAGLNPNLVYGNGSVATESSPVKSTPSGSWQPKAPDFKQVGNGVDSYLNTKMMNGQLDLLKQQTQNAQQDALLKAAQTKGIIQNTAGSSFDLGLKQDLRDNSINRANANLEKLYTDIGVGLSVQDVNRERATNIFTNTTKQAYETQFLRNENERREALNSANIAQAAERILLMRQQETTAPYERQRIQQQIENLKSNKDLMDYLNHLHENGLNQNDPLFWRQLRNLLDK